jgi:hypothetical protein
VNGDLRELLSRRGEWISGTGHDLSLVSADGHMPYGFVKIWVRAAAELHRKAAYRHI